MIVGFTGTRRGMTAAQHRAVLQLVQELRPTEVHHGCCVGADAELHGTARWFWPVHGHPGPDGPYRARLEGFTKLYPSKGYSFRNQDIANACDVLVAAPAESAPQSSGGTWQTVRRARAGGKRVVVVWPDGSRYETGR
jgi:hypothetical protein